MGDLLILQKVSCPLQDLFKFVIYLDFFVIQMLTIFRRLSIFYEVTKNYIVLVVSASLRHFFKEIKFH